MLRRIRVRLGLLDERQISLLALSVSTLSMVLSGGLGLVQTFEWWTRPDPREIRGLIEAEARLVKNREVDEVVALFSDDAVVRDLGWDVEAGKVVRRIRSWHKREQIRERYAELASTAEFTELSHIAIVVQFPEGSSASAISSTQGSFRWSGGPLTEISSVNGDRWEFRKEAGGWRIVSFSYHSAPNESR